MRESHAHIETEAGTDITGDLSDSLLSVQVTQRLHGRADEVSLTFEDRDGLWREDWMPSSGDRIRVRYELTDWREEGDSRRMDWGLFEIDKVRLTGAPSEVTIGAQSAFVTSSMRNQKRTEAWESTSFKELLQEIADRHDLTLTYGTSRNPEFERLDQTAADLRFVRQQAERWNIHCRVDQERLILTDDTELSELPDPIYRSGGPPMLTTTNFEMEERRYKLARKCRLVYDDPLKENPIEREVEDPGAPDTDEKKVVNERVKSPGQAEFRAKAALERNNREEKTASATITGRLQVRPGMIVPLEGFGQFDGKYVVGEASHSIDRSGYKTDCDLRIIRDPLV